MFKKPIVRQKKSANRNSLKKQKKQNQKQVKKNKINQVVFTDDGERQQIVYIYHLLGMFKGRRNGISGFEKFHRERMTVGIRFLRIKVYKEQMMKLYQFSLLLYSTGNSTQYSVVT